MRTISFLGSIFVAASFSAAISQETNVAFGGLRHDSSLPVEVTADQLQIEQANGTAVFTGNVLVAQGPLKLSSQTLRVEYSETDSSRIERIVAGGGVTIVSGQEAAAEARDAIYEIASGALTMTGDVLLTQGRNALSGERLLVDLNAGTGQMQGRVKTILGNGN